MNYKKIIKSQRLRFAILRALSFIPDKWMLLLQYYIKLGRKMNFKEPKRFTEKLQLYKLYYRHPQLYKYVDKFEVRHLLEDLGYGSLLVQLYGIYSCYDEIDFDILPDSFVIKSTDGGGGNGVIIVKDKSKLDYTDVKRRVAKWQQYSFSKINPGREWAYSGIHASRIIIEEYINADELIDYKFFCFSGKVKCLYVINGRELGVKCRLGIYDRDYRKLNVYRCDEIKQDTPVPKPLGYDKMINIVEELSKLFPHVRIDLYNVDGRVIFGEFTFYDGSGYQSYSPDSFDYELGEMFDLSFISDK